MPAVPICSGCIAPGGINSHSMTSCRVRACTIQPGRAASGKIDITRILKYLSYTLLYDSSSISDRSGPGSYASMIDYFRPAWYY